MSDESRNEAAWWETAVIYEIALISFQDSDGDGKGDLAGLASRIDYLKWLGVDAVWLTPIYKSPFRDLGYGLCRDPERAPMRWDDSSNGGFTTGNPWLPLEPPDGASNVAAQQRDARSILALFRALMALRRERACLRRGGYEPLRSRNDVLAYRRTDGGSDILVALNIAAEPRKWHWQGRGHLLMSTHLDRPSEPLPEASILLRGNEGIIIALEAR